MTLVFSHFSNILSVPRGHQFQRFESVTRGSGCSNFSGRPHDDFRRRSQRDRTKARVPRRSRVTERTDQALRGSCLPRPFLFRGLAGPCRPGALGWLFPDRRVIRTAAETLRRRCGILSERFLRLCCCWRRSGLSLPRHRTDQTRSLLETLWGRLACAACRWYDVVLLAILAAAVGRGVLVPRRRSSPCSLNDGLWHGPRLESGGRFNPQQPHLRAVAFHHAHIRPAGRLDGSLFWLAARCHRIAKSAWPDSGSRAIVYDYLAFLVPELRGEDHSRSAPSESKQTASWHCSSRTSKHEAAKPMSMA